MNINSIKQASIIIPTYNRASYLSICLEALAALDSDSKEFEIIIVDNNSTDNTRDVVLGFSETNPTMSIRYVLEIKQGVSNARNRGLTEAVGEIICFLDDDSPPDPDWLYVVLSSFDDPSIGCVGGPSILDFQGQDIPPWLRGDLQNLLSAYGLPYTKPAPVYMWEDFPFSCNMAIRKTALTKLRKPFPPDLGRIGDVKLTAGETVLIDRIYKAGWKIVYLPDAKVRHLVAPDRLDKSYIYKISYGRAVSHIILTSDPEPYIVLRWFASDGWYATRMFYGLVRALLQRKTLWFDDYMRFWTIAMRIPLRLKILLHGNTYSEIRSDRF